jgi:hypothetical protein
MTTGTLADIRRKIRFLTGRLSSNSISEDEIDDYINTFYLYDFPEELRVGSNASTFKFITEKNVSTYNLVVDDVFLPKFNDVIISRGGELHSPLDVYYTLETPVTISGSEVIFSQDLGEYLAFSGSQKTVRTFFGNGTSGEYEIQLTPSPVAQGSISIGAEDSSGSTFKVVDVPTSRTSGSFETSNTKTSVYGSVNYLTGDIIISFPNSVPTGGEIVISFLPYQPSIPSFILFHANQLKLSPIPDKPYEVEIKALTTPTKLTENSFPILRFWWQYLAYGAAKKILEDNGNLEGVQRIMPAFKEQENKVLYRNVAQYSQGRAETIYSGMVGSGGTFGL